jgi:hypothetical protein
VKVPEFDSAPGTGLEKTSNFVFLQFHATAGLQRDRSLGSQSADGQIIPKLDIGNEVAYWVPLSAGKTHI